MTRRLILTMVTVVAGALVVAVAGTALLLRANATNETRRELRAQARSMAQAIEVLQAPRALELTGRALRLQGQQIVRIGPGGRTADPLPAGVSAADLDLGRLQAGETITGTHGSLVFAAAPAPRRNTLLVVVLTRRTGPPLRNAAPLFALAAGMALAVAAVVAADLARRLTRPLRDAEAATGRIASGDFAARVAETDGTDEFARLSRSVNAMAAALERARGQERQFLLSVSHDLRTPLTSIRGYAEAIADGQAPDPGRAAETILTEARRLERLVADLLELARLDARRFSLDMQSVDLAGAVRAATDGFLPVADRDGITIDVVQDGSGPLVAADPDRLGQVIANLVENALRFASARIEVGGSSDQGAATLWVEDDGPGMDDADLERVFEAFYQSPRAAARPGGSGLGLAIVRQLVDAMGGSVAAEALASGGCRMTVRLRAWQRTGSHT